MARPLDGFRVLDLSLGPVAGTASMILGDFGAEVIHIEPPGGDPFRAMAHSPAWLRGKLCVEADLGNPGALEAIRRLARDADVFLTTLSRSRCEELGLDEASLGRAHPALVSCRITGFGSEGPYANYPAYEGLAAAKSGRMLAFQGIAEREGPAYSALPVGNHAASQAAVQGIVAALIEREASGLGQHVETSLLRALEPYDLLGLLRSQLIRRRPEIFAAEAAMAAQMRVPTLNYHPLPTKDGRWLQMGNLLQHLFDNYLAAAELFDILGDPDYEGAPALWPEQIREPFRDRMLLHMKTKTAAEWMQIFVEHGGVAATEYRQTHEALDDPDLVDNGHVVKVDHPRHGPMKQIGLLARLAGTPGAVGAPSHDAGADNAVLFSGWRQPRAALPVMGASLAAPLAGHTIIEFATIIAAPLGVSILGDLGARIIKVEPIGGDPYRGLGAAGIMAAKTNASKESIGVDLKHPAGREIVHRLVARSDALIHNYRPGVPERLGIGYEECRALRPDLVHVSVNGYGPLGPGAHRPSTHPVPGAGIGGATLQAAGAHECSADDVQELRAIATRLFRANEANPDPNTSVVIASSTLLALLARKRTGAGQQVFVDMFGANAWANADDFIDYAGRPARPMPDAGLHGLCATYRLYRAAEGWVFVAVPSDAEFAAFCRRAGAPGLAADARFTTAPARAANDDPLAKELAALFATRAATDWEALLAPAGVGCVRADAAPPGDFWLDDPHVRETGLVVPVHHARYGDSLRWGTLQDFSRTPCDPGPGALGGDATSSLLAEVGYSAEEAEGLGRDGVVWSEEVAPIP